MNSKLIKFIFLASFIFLGLYNKVSAHAPYYINTESRVSTQEPEVSKAYYAELDGKPAEYTITSDKPFSFYINILVPDIEGVTKDFLVQVENDKGSVVATLDGENFIWERWYENFAGDWYYKGPEYKKTLEAGVYKVIVSNKTNTGKYVLAPGEKEVFTIGGTPKTISEIYKIKTKFFNKNAFSIFEGIIGRSLLGMHIFIVLLIIGGTYLIRKRNAKKVF